MHQLRLSAFALAAAVVLSGASLHAQTAGQDMKDAGHDTAHATKRVARKTGHVTKRAAKDTGHATKVTAGKTAYNTRKVGDKIADKPTPPKSEDPHYSNPH